MDVMSENVVCRRAVAEARREQMEADCAAVLAYMANEVELWPYISRSEAVAAIRARYAEQHGEGE